MKRAITSYLYVLQNIGVFYSKRCNLATFKLQQTLSLNAKKFTKQKKRQKKPRVS